MPAYVVLTKLTAQGRQRLNAHMPQLRQAFQQTEQMVGFKVHEWWMTMGPYDSVAVVEAPSDEAITLAILADSLKGDAETVTMRAFTLDEAERLVSQLSTPS